MAVAPPGVVAVRRGVAAVGLLQGDAEGLLRGGVAGLLREAAAVAFLVVVAAAVVDLRQEVGGGDSPRVAEAVGVIKRGCVLSLGREKKVVSIDSLLLVSCFSSFLSCFWSTSCILQKRNCFSIIDPA